MDDRVRIALVSVVLAAAFSCAHGSEPAGSPTLEGLWQYPDRAVWIHVWPDGLVFQCRIAPDGTIFASEGMLTGASVTWAEIWPDGSFAFTDERGLLLEDAWGRYVFARGCRMSAPCAERASSGDLSTRRLASGCSNP